MSIRLLGKDHLGRFLPKGGFFRSVSLLAVGTAAGQAVMVAVSPLLTRLYSPTDFGVFAVYSSLLSASAVVAGLRYPLAVPLAADDDEAADLVVLSLLVVFGMALLIASGVLLFGRQLLGILNASELSPYLWILPLGLLFVGIYGTLNYWAIRTSAFKVIARTKLTQALSMAVVQVGASGFGPVALMLGHVAGGAAGWSTLGTLALRGHKHTFLTITWRRVLAAAIKYRRFPIYSTWGAVFNTFGSQLPPLLFAALFNPAAAGLYMLANRVLAMPMTMIGKAMADVFLSRVASANRNGSLAPLVDKVHSTLAHIAMAPALILVLTGPELFTLVFGPEWTQAGQFARWMSPWLYIVFVTSPISHLMSVVERQSQEMVFQAVLLGVRVSAILAGAWVGSVNAAVALFSVAGVICWGGYLFWMMGISGNNAFSVLRPTVDAFRWALLIASPILAAAVLGNNRYFVLASLFSSAVLMAFRYVKLANGREGLTVVA